MRKKEQEYTLVHGDKVTHLGEVVTVMEGKFLQGSEFYPGKIIVAEGEERMVDLGGGVKVSALDLGGRTLVSRHDRGIMDTGTHDHTIYGEVVDKTGKLFNKVKITRRPLVREDFEPVK